MIPRQVLDVMERGDLVAAVWREGDALTQVKNAHGVIKDKERNNYLRRL
jgi:hypothetical protein